MTQRQNSNLVHALASTTNRRVASKDLCRCRTFCLEDCARTGRLCRLEVNRQKNLRKESVSRREQSHE